MTNNNKKIVIIGAGASGLVSAIYARHCGFDVTVYEKNPNLGGCCCGWERKGNYIDGCIHWLMGCRDDGSTINDIWKTCGVFDGQGVHFAESFLDFDIDGEMFHWYTDLTKLKNEMLRVAPEDKKRINKFVRMVKNYIDFPMPTQKPVDLYNIFELTKIGVTLAARYAKMTVHSKISAENYSKKFKSPILQKVIGAIVPPKYNLMSALYMIGALASGDSAIPIGGSQAMSDRMAARARALGCNIFTNCGVKNIIVENHTACGVTLENGETVAADYVISTVDATHALDKLLEGKYPVPDFSMRNADRNKYPLYTYTFTALKVHADISHLHHDAVIKADFGDLGTPCDMLSLRNYSYDPTLKGEDGSTVMQVCLVGLDEMYDYWKAQRANGNYRARKAEVGKTFQQIVENYYPELKGKTEIIDVVTPLTYERYLNTRNGTFQGYIATDKSKPLDARNYIPELSNFVFSGQWLMRSGGLPAAAYQGRFAIQRICDWEKVKFTETRKNSLLRQLKEAFGKKQKI